MPDRETDVSGSRSLLRSGGRVNIHVCARSLLMDTRRQSFWTGPEPKFPCLRQQLVKILASALPASRSYQAGLAVTDGDFRRMFILCDDLQTRVRESLPAS